jgi:hypothetical protein
MRRLAILLIAVLAFPLAARADEASKRAKIDELFTVMHMDRTMQQLMDAMEKQVIPMTQQMFGGGVPEPLKQQVADMQKQMFQLIEQQMGWKAMEPAYVEIYARNFTEDQIDDIVAFYKTPTGAALLDKLPALTTEGMQAAQAKMVTLEPQIKKMIDDFAKQNAEAIKRAHAMQKSGA